MSLFSRRTQRPADSPPVPTDGVYGNARPGHSTNNLQPPQQSFVSLSAAHSPPPPPYNAYDHDYLQPYSQSAPLYFQSQQYLPMSPPLRPGLSPYASATTLDLSRPHTAGGWAQEAAQQSSSNLAFRPATSGQAGCMVARGLNQGNAFCERVTQRLNDMLARSEDPTLGLEEAGVSQRELHPLVEEDDMDMGQQARVRQAEEKEKSGSVINWQKTWLYGNSRLPPGMVPFKAYLPTWTLVCRAAAASLDVYTRPPKGQREYFTDADPREGTKATIIKSQPVDDRTLIIVAIRGSQLKRVDWLVNFALSPTAPVDDKGDRFLDDRGNACHAGFLECSRAMVHSVAEQLKDLIQRDPSCAASSLLFTGHSAGGAVATLLYMHMIGKKVKSTELTDIAGVFKRIHCVTFGAPPLSLLPLQKPHGSRHEKDVFLSFANEGDLVVRASRPYFLSLVKALAAPAPAPPGRPKLRERVSRQKLRGDDAVKPVSNAISKWPVPDATLSNAGRLVLLRKKPKTKHHKVEAVQLTDAQLREVLFGDPAMHSMVLYKQRIDDLAFAAVAGTDIG